LCCFSFEHDFFQLFIVCFSKYALFPYNICTYDLRTARTLLQVYFLSKLICFEHSDPPIGCWRKIHRNSFYDFYGKIAKPFKAVFNTNIFNWAKLHFKKQLICRKACSLKIKQQISSYILWTQRDRKVDLCVQPFLHLCPAWLTQVILPWRENTNLAEGCPVQRSVIM
jgi:hypothetical protein